MMVHLSSDITGIARDITVAAVSNPSFFNPSGTQDARVLAVVDLYKKTLEAVKETIEK
ncbi:MAG TPA: hypothetical protein VMW91_01465 [Desulfosporosinus sp.]|nr:hypothetical protein [Desulfosporosinus sp.]